MPASRRPSSRTASSSRHGVSRSTAAPTSRPAARLLRALRRQAELRLRQPSLLFGRQDMNWETSTTRQVLAALYLFGVLMALPAAAQEPNGIFVYQSDFGLKDGAVSEMRGVA